jgi:predicted ATP-grasp superfamily ATP-dependent carboligase
MSAPTAVVMNMLSTGLGIARSLGARGVPVIGLSSESGVFGNFTRYAKVVFTPDSRHEPEALLERLVQMGKESASKRIIFPTRDHDVVFLDRFRPELEPYYSLVAPKSPAVQACLNKWETYQCARKAGVAAPRSWLIEGESDLARVAGEIVYPCVLKPLAAYQWRKARNWALVGGRKAIPISSEKQLRAEYALVAGVEKQVLLQEMVPGSDDCLVMMACCFDRNARWMGGFNTQKLAQEPEGYGTGCVVQTVSRPELIAPTMRLLEQMNYSGIAEVEYKWHEAEKVYKLIEINPRPWDQHRLGYACGMDLIYLAYCDHAGWKPPAMKAEESVTWKWVSEEPLIMAALAIRGRSHKTRFFRLARGKRIYSIWWWRDPLPFLAYVALTLIPQLAGVCLERVRSIASARTQRKALLARGGSA